MKQIFKPIPYFVICSLLLLSAASSAFIDARDILNYGNEFDTLLTNVVNLLLSIVVIIACIFGLLKYLWARAMLLIVLYALLVNHFLAVLIEPNAGGSFVGIAVISGVVLYVQLSKTLKREFDQARTKQLQSTAESTG